MNIPKKDLKIETMRGQGKGGQHRNKTDSCVRITHIPTGINATVDGRHQGKNKKLAMKELYIRLQELKDNKKAQKKKHKRDIVIHERNIVRTYDYKKGIVYDHRTGKHASLKQIMKGKLELLK